RRRVGHGHHVPRRQHPSPSGGRSGRLVWALSPSAVTRVDQHAMATARLGPAVPGAHDQHVRSEAEEGSRIMSQSASENLREPVSRETRPSMASHPSAGIVPPGLISMLVLIAVLITICLVFR